MGRIVQDHDELARILRVFRTQGKSVVFIQGSFDLLHVGHIRSIIDAASRGHYLIVGVASDAAVRREIGKGYPVQPAAERAEIISSIDGVDYVTSFDPVNDELLERLRPTAVALASGDSVKRYPGADALRESGTEFLSVGGSRKHTEDKLIAKIHSLDSPSRNGSAKTAKTASSKASAAKASASKGKKAVSRKAVTAKAKTKKATKTAKASKKTVAAKSKSKSKQTRRATA